MNKLVILKATDVDGILFEKESDLINIVKSVYINHHNGYSSLPHSVFLRFPNPKNRIIGLPAYLSMNESEMAGIKWISSFPDNTLVNMERASAVIILNDMETGRAKAVIEGSIISAKRTAASAALAAKSIHPNVNENKIGIIGCGRINREIVSYLISQYKSIEQIVVFDSLVQRSEQFVNILRSLYPHLCIRNAKSYKEIFDETLLISVATTATIPYLDEQLLCRNNATILDISLRDFSPDFVLKCDNIVDDVEHVCRENTSMELTEKTIGNRTFIRCTLADIILGEQENRVSNKPSLFSPFGLGILDLALADYIFDYAVNNGIGTEIEDFYI